MKKLHPNIWEIIYKSYKHTHGESYLPELLQSMPLSKEPVLNPDKNIENQVMEFLKSMPLEDGLIVIKDALEDGSIKALIHSDWNYWGDFVRNWRGQLVTCLESNNGIIYDAEKKAFFTQGTKQTMPLAVAAKEELIKSTFDDMFYNDLKKEINQSFSCGLFTASFILSRKMIENLLIDILRLKYPTSSATGNLDLYYRVDPKAPGRFHDFTVLLKNVDDRKADFTPDTEIITEFLPLVKIFRPQSNARTHSLIIISEEKDLVDAKIDWMVELLLKLRLNLQNEIRKAH